MASKWRELGRHLNIPKHLMENIEHDHPHDCETCCSKMFSEWLNINPDASWEDIINAVDDISFYGMYILVT